MLCRISRQCCNVFAAEGVFCQWNQQLYIAGFRTVGIIDDALGRALEFSRRPVVCTEDHRGIFLTTGQRDTASQLGNYACD